MEKEEISYELFGAWGVKKIENEEEFVSEFVAKHGEGFFHMDEYGKEKGYPQVAHKCYDFSGPSWAHREWECIGIPNAVDIRRKEAKQ